MSRPRIGFLGAGWIGRSRMQAMIAGGQIEAVAIHEPSAEAAAEALKLAPNAEIAHSFDELLKLGLDGMVIATPSALHADQAIRALDRGIAVFCQKPLGRNAREVEQVVEAARSSDRLLGVDLSYRGTAGMQAVRELVSSGALGRIYAVNLLFHNAYGPDKPWFYDRALSGGGCLIDLGIHLVDLALWSLGFPEVTHTASRLFAQGRALGVGQVEDFAAATLDLAGGVAVQLACSWKLQAGRDAVIAAEFYGTAGGAAFRNVNGSFYDFTAERFDGTNRACLTSPPEDWGGRTASAWAGALARGERFAGSTTGLIEAARAIDRIYASARP